METSEQQDVRARLRSPPIRETRSLAGLVAELLPEIQQARRDGKTWSMIGRDLQPDNPARADTVRKAVERKTTGRARKTQTRERRSIPRVKTSVIAMPQPELQLSDSNNPFGRQVDPIRDCS